ncbi:MAG: Holliday junction branch migration protein RuvA [Mariprofundaceae bacterium]
MIGWLSGAVRHVDPAGLALIDAGGVGYEVHVPMQTLCQLRVGEPAALFIHTHVREDQITLFAFADIRERALFRQLTGVSGIGARTGLNILSGMSRQDLLLAVEAADVAAISRIPGIGKKTAQRLILELKGKLVDETDAMPAASSITADVRSALLNLGYKPAQVDGALKAIGNEQDFEAAFKAALKGMG